MFGQLGGSLADRIVFEPPSPVPAAPHYPPSTVVTFPPGILARGPWQSGQVAVSWRQDSFEPDADQNAEADRAIAELEHRGSPAHDGLAARLCRFEADADVLRLEL